MSLSTGFTEEAGEEDGDVDPYLLASSEVGFPFVLTGPILYVCLLCKGFLRLLSGVGFSAHAFGVLVWFCSRPAQQLYY